MPSVVAPGALPEMVTPGSTAVAARAAAGAGAASARRTVSVPLPVRDSCSPLSSSALRAACSAV